MPDIAIQVEHISKCYRIGLKEQISETLGGAIGSWLKAPFSNLRRLRRLTRFNADETGAPSGFESKDLIWALSDISFSVGQGEVIGIIGRNGAGKSTLLKILSRIVEPTAGRALINGRVASLLEVGTGFHPELTGRENVYLNGAVLGMSKAEIDSKFDAIVAFAEVEKFLDTPVKRYSSGMGVRLAFAVAAHLEPEILLIDEVLAVGDAAFQKKCLGKMGEVATEGRTVIFVSHHMGAIQNLCRRCLLIENGRLAMDADANECVSRYLDKNLIKGAVADAGELEQRMEGVILKKNPYVRFHEVRLKNRLGQVTSAFDSDEEVIVTVSFQCLQPINDLRIVVQVVDENNTPVIMTQSVDDAHLLEHFYHLDAGYHAASCVFPENIFSERKFYLTVHLIYPLTEHITVNKILEFDVKFKNYNNMPIRGAVKGLLRPRLEWFQDQL